jgi:hypothetical protein
VGGSLALSGGLLGVLFAAGVFNRGPNLSSARDPRSPAGPPASTDNTGASSPPAGGVGPSAWKQFVSAEGRFKVRMPVGSAPGTTTVESPTGGVLRGLVYNGKDGRLNYVAAYLDCEAPLQGAVFDHAFAKGRDALVRSTGGVLDSEKEIELSGRRGREYVIRLPRGGAIRWRSYADGARLYIVQVDYAAPPGPPDADVLAFFDSFQITGAGP